jgi:AbrB family looped-hinge helix DNA binding protein
MTQVHIGHMKVRKVGTSLVVTIPKPAAEALGISEGDILDVSVEPMELRPRLDPAFRAAAEAALAQIQPGLDYLKDR